MKNLFLVIAVSFLSLQAQASVKAAGGATGEIEVEDNKVIFQVFNRSPLPIACTATVLYTADYCTVVEYEPGKPKRKCKRDDVRQRAKFKFIDAQSSTSGTFFPRPREGVEVSIVSKAQVADFECKEAGSRSSKERAKTSDRHAAKPDHQFVPVSGDRPVKGGETKSGGAL